MMSVQMVEFWNEYLNKVTGPERDLVRELWIGLKKIVGESLAVPQAGPVAGAVFGFIWEAKEQYIEIELLSNGHFDWFYTNKVTGAYEGRDGCSLLDFPARLAELLRQFS